MPLYADHPGPFDLAVLSRTTDSSIHTVPVNPDIRNYLVDQYGQKRDVGQRWTEEDRERVKELSIVGTGKENGEMNQKGRTTRAGTVCSTRSMLVIEALAVQLEEKIKEASSKKFMEVENSNFKTVVADSVDLEVVRVQHVGVIKSLETNASRLSVVQSRSNNSSIDIPIGRQSRHVSIANDVDHALAAKITTRLLPYFAAAEDTEMRIMGAIAKNEYSAFSYAPVSSLESLVAKTMELDVIPIQVTSRSMFAGFKYQRQINNEFFAMDTLVGFSLAKSLMVNNFAHDSSDSSKWHGYQRSSLSRVC